MKRGKVIFILLALCGLVLLCGCSGTTTVSDREKIEATIEGFFRALFSSRLEEARSYLVPGGPTETELNSLYEEFLEVTTQLAACEITVDATLGDVEINGNRAEATVSSLELCATCPGQTGPSCFSLSGGSFQLEKHSGEWLIY
ncbi:MAG: hypothetical protein H5U36_03190 [Candidatus Caldatribacterium sp.]|nr:hypothetical protein [Candidatus Caldatribacterium sp.]